MDANTAVGSTVEFRDWDRNGEYVKYTGVVESEFREPPEEDRYQRLNYGVRVAAEHHTPYAHDCRPVAE